MKQFILISGFILIFSLPSPSLVAQYNGDFTAIRAKVDFSKMLRDWDGFGFNYVQVAQSIDYDKYPQEYGGFSLLIATERQTIRELVFGENGVRPKTFLVQPHDNNIKKFAFLCK